MNVTLNQNSWHFKIYSKVVGSNPPKTLCPYFWTLVAILVLSPALLFIFVIGFIIEFFNNISKNRRIKKEMADTRTYEQMMEEQRKKWDEEDRREKKSYERWSKITEIVIKVFKWGILPLICIGVICAIFAAGSTMGWKNLLIMLGIAVGVALFIISLVWFFEKFGSKIFGPIGRGLGKLNPFKWGITQIIGGMIYAAYKKACPMITWEGEVKKDEYGIN